MHTGMDEGHFYSPLHLRRVTKMVKTWQYTHIYYWFIVCEGMCLVYIPCCSLLTLFFWHNTTQLLFV